MRVPFCLGVFCAGAAILFAAPVRADVLDMTMSTISGHDLYLPDGQWQEGDDWGWAPLENGNASAWAKENWIGMGQVNLGVGVKTDGIDPDVVIQKDLTNDTNFDWIAFTIDLMPAPGFGPLVVYPGSVASSRFSGHDVTNHADGSATIDYFITGEDRPVSHGEFVAFFFTFNVPGDVFFQMKQTPVPEPTALGLLLMGVFVAARRQRL